MQRAKLALSAGIALALVGCQSGCDGERAKGAQQPHPEARTSSDAAPTAAIVEPPIAPPVGFLDAHLPGTLEAGLFTGLAAAEKRDANGRALVLFFGDSHGPAIR